VAKFESRGNSLTIKGAVWKFLDCVGLRRSAFTISTNRRLTASEQILLCSLQNLKFIQYFFLLSSNINYMDSSYESYEAMSFPQYGNQGGLPKYEMRAPPRRRTKDIEEQPLFLRKAFTMVTNCPDDLGKLMIFMHFPIIVKI
jgi:hypothetical protein